MHAAKADDICLMEMEKNTVLLQTFSLPHLFYEVACFSAIIWECLNTVTSIIDGDSTLTKSSIDCITKMLRSNNTDLNYSGKKQIFFNMLFV